MKRKNMFLLAAFCVVALGYFALTWGRAVVQTEDYDQKIEASRRAQACFEAVRDLKTEMGLPMDMAKDINGTGLIGQDFSGITTTLGNLEAKRTSTNPNMAAVVVDMFHELNLKPGDKVAVNYSGSFPALNIATLCAAEVMGIEPVIMASFGASTHGANDPELTYPDMERYLNELGLVSSKIKWFSIGGMEDVGKEMDGAVKAEIVERLEGYGYQFLYDEDLIRNIYTRYELYRAYPDIKCFINVGGNDASFGDSSVMVYMDGGILTQVSDKDSSTGLVQLFLRDNIPVIHLLNIKSVATQYGLPIDPSPMPAVGEGGVYHTYEYNSAAAILVLALAAALLYLARRAEKRPGREA